MPSTPSLVKPDSTSTSCASSLSISNPSSSTKSTAAPTINSSTANKEDAANNFAKGHYTDFYQPFKEDEFEQSTEVQIIFLAEPKPVFYEFDWEFDELEKHQGQRPQTFLVGYSIVNS
ncbi:hypothetical protein JHK85_004645 [Glycine max]|nr:hypothetical protein JHK85_004645 [Glycine max]